MIQISIPVTFKLKMETERAYIVTELHVSNMPYITEAVLPKMLVDADVTKEDDNGFISANVEKWVLEQRYNEEANQAASDGVKELLNLKYSEKELADLPF